MGRSLAPLAVRRTLRRRSGFTLLEVLLASVIAMFLLGGLYVMFDITMRQTQEARDVVDASRLSRAVFQRMGQDLASSLSPLPPKSGGNSSGSTSSSSTSTDTGSTETAPPASGTGTSPTAGSPADSAGTMPTDDGTIDGTTVVAADVPFQAGVVGTGTQLTMFVSRVPAALGDSNLFSQIVSQNSTGEGSGSDLIRVSYWLASTGTGLCRQERPWVTADGIRNTTEPDRSDEAGDIIADEVIAATFEYFDGTTGQWLTEWDGSMFGPDGVTPTGPPRAVRVTLTLSIASSRPNVPPQERTVIQVIPVRTAAGVSTPPLLETGNAAEEMTDTSGGGT